MSLITEQTDGLYRLAKKLQDKNDNGMAFPENRARAGKMVKNAADTIRELSDKLHTANMVNSSKYYNNGWVPCADGEHYPEDKADPVTRDGYVYPVTVEMHGNPPHVRYYTFANGHWHHGPQVMDQFVTAWMDRPAPYKGGF